MADDEHPPSPVAAGKTSLDTDGEKRRADSSLLGSLSEQELGALFQPALDEPQAAAPTEAQTPSGSIALSSLAQEELSALSSTARTPVKTMVVEEVKPTVAPPPVIPSEMSSSALFHYPAIAPPAPRTLTWRTLPLWLRVALGVMSLALLAALVMLTLLLLRSRPMTASDSVTRSRGASVSSGTPSPAPPVRASDSRTPQVPTTPAQHSLEPKDVMAVVLAHRSAIEACVTAEQTRQPDIEGVLVMRFTVDTTGKVSSAQAKTEDFKDGPLEACLRAEILSWEFPPHRVSAPPIDFPFKL